MRLQWRNPFAGGFRGPDATVLARSFTSLGTWLDCPLYEATGTNIANSGAANTTHQIQWATALTDEHKLNPDGNHLIQVPPTREYWLVEAQARALAEGAAAFSVILFWQRNGGNVNAQDRVDLGVAGGTAVTADLEKIVKANDTLQVNLFSGTAALAYTQLEVTLKLTPLNG